MANFTTVPSMERILHTNEEVTKVPAVEMIRRSLTTSTLEHGRILDNACGSGVVTAELVEYFTNNPTIAPPELMIAADIDSSMTSYTQRRREQISNEDSGWQKVQVETFDQQRVPLPDGTFTHIYSNFGVFFSQDDQATLSETLRLLKPGGLAAFATWEEITWFRSLAVPALAKYLPEINPPADPVMVFPSKGWHSPELIEAKLREAGFTEIEVLPYRYSLPRGAVDHSALAEATAFLIKALLKFSLSAEDYSKHEAKVEPAFRDYLEEKYPDGYWDGQMAAMITIARREKAAEPFE